MNGKKPPLSSKEIEARRRNAQKSTGPRSPAGKRRVAQNARKNGLYTRAQSHW